MTEGVLSTYLTTALCSNMTQKLFRILPSNADFNIEPAYMKENIKIITQVNFLEVGIESPVTWLSP